jgi:hypothetical protein
MIEVHIYGSWMVGMQGHMHFMIRCTCIVLKWCFCISVECCRSDLLLNLNLEY